MVHKGNFLFLIFSSLWDFFVLNYILLKWHVGYKSSLLNLLRANTRLPLPSGCQFKPTLEKISQSGVWPQRKYIKRWSKIKNTMPSCSRQIPVQIIKTIFALCRNPHSLQRAQNGFSNFHIFIVQKTAQNDRGHAMVLI